MAYQKSPKFSYSKLNTYDSCGWKYYLTYDQGHYVFAETLATELGTLLHHIEQQIAIRLQNGEKIDYDYMINEFQTINIPRTSKLQGGVLGLNYLREKYEEEFYKIGENGDSYFTKTIGYMTTGIYRLEEYLKVNPNFKVYGTEKFFSVDFEGKTLSGFIDRIFYNEADGKYIIEDIKTKGKMFKDSELVTPLQFVVYVYALAQALEISYDDIACFYDLPFCNTKQSAGTPGFMTRGLKKLHNIFEGIDQGNFVPSPSPLCAYCTFSPTNPDQPEEGKLLCPYYSLWTKDHKSFRVAHEWRGIDHHGEIMQDEIDKINKNIEAEKKIKEFNFEF